MQLKCQGREPRRVGRVVNRRFHRLAKGIHPFALALLKSRCPNGCHIVNLVLGQLLPACGAGAVGRVTPLGSEVCGAGELCGAGAWGKSLTGRPGRESLSVRNREHAAVIQQDLPRDWWAPSICRAPGGSSSEDRDNHPRGVAARPGETSVGHRSGSETSRHSPRARCGCGHRALPQ